LRLALLPYVPGSFTTEIRVAASSRNNIGNGKNKELTILKWTLLLKSPFPDEIDGDEENMEHCLFLSMLLDSF
jgi:hypothetical protein